MPRRALRCVVDLDIRRVSAPGVWLPSREDVYLSITLFNQYRNTRSVTSVFPLVLHEPFRFEKTYYTACDPAEVADFLENELIIFELVQFSDYSDGAVRLATYCTDARDFLYPYPTLSPSYPPETREILMSRTVAFPGISPKIEFTCKTVIKESRSAELDALEDALEEERIQRKSRSRSRSRSRTRGRSRSRTPSRARSKSPAARKYYEVSSRSKSPTRYASSSDEGVKAPFVVRHLEKSLIGRLPGSPPEKAQKLKKSKKGRSSSLGRSYSLGVLCPVCYTYNCPYNDDGCFICSAYLRYFGKPYLGHTHEYHRKVIRDRAGYSLPVYETKYLSDEDDDAEVAALTSDLDTYVPPPRPRSASPFLYKSSYTTRFSDRPYSPALSDRVSDRVARAIARSRSPSPYYGIRDSLDDLAIDTSVVKNRRYYPSLL